MATPPLPDESDTLTIATAVLRGEPDVVTLCRRVRRAGEELGIDRAALRRLTPALFEVGRLVCSEEADTVAAIGTGEGPSLQARFHVGDLRRLGGRAALERLLAPLAPVVARLEVIPVEHGAVVNLEVPLGDSPPRAGHRPAAAAADTAPPAPSGGDVSREEHEALRRAYSELQRELRETNQGVVALYADLDEHTERLQVAEDRLRLLLDSVHDYAICLLSPAGVVTSWNAGGERLFGYSTDEVVGESFERLYPAEDRERGLPAAHLRAAGADGRVASEGVRTRRDGSIFDAHVVLTAIQDAHADLQGFSLVVRDVTERKRLEDDLRRRAEDLAAANRAKEDFLATLSHELRTPLNAMLGWTRLLRMGKLDDAGVARALETIERNAHLQEQLIADILDVSRIVTGKLRLELRPTDLATLVDASVDALRPAAEAKGLILRSRIDVNAMVLGDPDRLQQVIWNLLANAIKFTPPGGSVDVALDRQGAGAVVTVSDTGQGISADLLPYVFDRFRQGDASVTRPHGGLGLGLSIVRHIVELHGGRVLVASDGEGRGATFSVQLPLRAIGRERGRAPSLASLSGLRVLVVDDESDARELVVRTLSGRGANMAAAGSTPEALRMVREFKPDVLVSDLRMPGEDGYALIRHVRALDESADLPAVAITALVQPDERRRALTAGFQSFVPKPLEEQALVEAVRRVSRRR